MIQTDWQTDGHLPNKHCTTHNPATVSIATYLNELEVCVYKENKTELLADVPNTSTPNWKPLTYPSIGRWIGYGTESQSKKAADCIILNFWHSKTGKKKKL